MDGFLLTSYKWNFTTGGLPVKRQTTSVSSIYQGQVGRCGLSHFEDRQSGILGLF